MTATMDLGAYLVTHGFGGGEMRGLTPKQKLQLRNLDHARAWSEESGIERDEAGLSQRLCNKLTAAGLVEKKKEKVKTSPGCFQTVTRYWLSPQGRRVREAMDA